MSPATGPRGDEPAPTTVCFTVEIEAGSQPIRGRIRSPGDPEREFVGMLDLVIAIQALDAPAEPEAGRGQA